MTAYDWVTLAAILVCLLLAAFFSASETAIAASSRARMTKLEKQGNRQAGAVNQLLRARERMLGAMLLGGTAAKVAAAALAAGTLVFWFGEIGLFYAVIIVTLLTVFAEMLAKAAAQVTPDAIALSVVKPAQLAMRVLGPAFGAVETLAHRAIARIGIHDGESDAALSSQEDARGSSDPQRDNGGDKADRDTFGGVLDLRELEVSDVMIHRTKMIMLDADLPAEEAVRQALTAPVTHLPLWRDEPGNIVGLLRIKDLLRALQAAGGDASKIDIMAIAASPWYVPDTTPLYEQLMSFRRRQTPIALVVDEYGEVMGLVTIEDILEEIVGDITDEHDVVVAGVRPQPDGSVNVDGGVAIRDLNRVMDWHLPDSEATTVAGLVIHEARSIPEPGQSFTFHGFRFRVLRKSRNRITALRITPLVRKRAAARTG